MVLFQDWRLTCTLGFLVVVIEFGHNDGGSPNTSEGAPVGGEDDTITQTVTLANGTAEVVHTWPWCAICY